MRLEFGRRRRVSVLIAAFCLSTSSGFSEEPEEFMLRLCRTYKQRTFLLSYPRSGNTWLRFCLEFTTHRPTLVYHTNPEHIQPFSLPLGLLYDLGTEIDGEPIWKVHSLPRMEKLRFNAKRDLLILLLRDYKQCLFSDLRSWEKVMKSINNSQSIYFENLNLYDRWDREHRILIYYEDFLANPRPELERLLIFLKIPPALEPFYLHLDELQSLSLQFYREYIRPEKAAKSREGQPSDIDECVRRLYPKLWERYLSRYAS